MASFYIESTSGRQIADPSQADPTKFYIEAGTGRQISGAQLKGTLGAAPVAPTPLAPTTPPPAPTVPRPSAPAAMPTGLGTLPQIGAVPQPTSTTFAAPRQSSSSSLVDFANALDQATTMAKSKRNASSLGMMMGSQGTLAASDFNGILGNLNAASDNTAQNLTNRAITAATPTFQTQTIGNDIYQVKYGADGSYQGAEKIGTSGTHERFGLQTIGDTTYQVQYDGNNQIIAATPMHTAAATGSTAAGGTTGAATPLPTSQSALPTIALQPGSTGIEVSKLQKALGIPQTGVYDDATTQAVKALQEKLGVDNSSGPGYYGPRTMAALGIKQPTTSTSSTSSPTPVKVTWTTTQKNNLIGAGLPAAQMEPLFSAIQQQGLQYVLANSDLTAAQKSSLNAIYGIKPQSDDLNTLIDAL